MAPNVVVITPTWRRHDLLRERCAPSVRAQRYGGEIRHIICSDGPDPDLAKLVGEMPGDVTYLELEDHRPELSNWGARARNHALERAGIEPGDVVCYLDDDNAYRPDHVARLVEALYDYPTADFAYSQMLVHAETGGYVIGHAPPTLGGIDTSVIAHWGYVPAMYGPWPVPGTIEHCPDWEMVARWTVGGGDWPGGALFTFINRITVDYYLGTPPADS